MYTDISIIEKKINIRTSKPEHPILYVCSNLPNYACINTAVSSSKNVLTNDQLEVIGIVRKKRIGFDEFLLCA